MSTEYGIFYDYVPDYNIYTRQKIESGLEAAIMYTLRSIYSKRTLLPQVPGLFLDMERWRHKLDSDESLMAIKKEFESNLSGIMGQYNPAIEFDYNKATGLLKYTVTYSGHGSVQVYNGETLLKANIKINKKKFFD